MNTLRTPILMFASVLILSACGGGGSKKDGKDDKGGKKDTAKEKKVSRFNYKPRTTKVAITTYKHTAKNGVGIKFDSISVQGVASDAKSVSGLFADAKFTIPVSGLNSGKPDRDKKIREHFFGTMKKTSAITGSVKNMKLEGKKGSATVNIKMNGNAKDVKMKLKKEKNALTLTGEIDAMNWNAKKALDALQKACEEKHTGKDGKTKLWSTVALKISTKLDVKERLAS
jgi:polyisoprenoid-binding protein YceI